MARLRGQEQAVEEDGGEVVKIQEHTDPEDLSQGVAGDHHEEQPE